MAFNITAQLQLQAPTNLRPVVNQIQSALRNIQANVVVNVSPGTATAIQGINRQLDILRTNLAAVGTAASGMNTVVNTASRTLAGAANAAATTARQTAASSQSMRAVSNALNEGAAAAENFGRAAGLAARRYSAFLVAGGAIISIINGIRNATKEAFLFEREMVRLVQVGAGTRQQIAEIEREITKLSTSMGVSSKELAQTSVVLAQAGFNATQTAQALEALAQAALSPNFGNMTQTVEGAIAIMQQFKVSAQDLGGALGSINAVASAFAVESKDIIEAVKRAGGAFRTTGGDLNEFIALFTSVRATTRESAEAISTGMRTIFQRIQRQDTVQALESLGVQLRFARTEASAMGNVNLEGQFVGPYEAVVRLNRALQDLATTDPRFTAIVEQLGGYRQISRVLPLIQELTTSQKALTIAQQGQFSLAQAAGQAQDSTVVRLQKLKEEFLSLFRTVTESKGFQVFLDMTLKVASAVAVLADKLTPLIPMLGALAALKVAQGFAGFASGITTGLLGGVQQSRNVVRRNSGGIVPGVGDSDSVPALLTPGEYVIRKQAVQAIGVNRLAHMNEGGRVRYATGGAVRRRPRTVDELLAQDASTANFPFMEEEGDTVYDSVTRNELQSILNREDNARKLTTSASKNLGSLRTNREKAVGREKLARGRLATDVLHIPLPTDRIGMIYKGSTGQSGINLQTIGKLANVTSINDRVKKKIQDAGIGTIEGTYDSHVISQEANELYSQEFEQKINNVISGLFKSEFPDSKVNFQLSRAEQRAVSGQIFQKYVAGLADTNLQSTDLDFDFASNALIGTRIDKFLEPQLAPAAGRHLVDVKLGASKGKYSVLGKYFNYLDRQGELDPLLAVNASPIEQAAQAAPAVGGTPIAKALGGSIHGVGSDTVPALLTPGEFVLNTSAVSRLGVPYLNQLNNVRKYNTGGYVEPIHMATGGSVPAPTGGGVFTGKLTDAAQTAGLSMGEFAQAMRQLAAQAAKLGVALDTQTRVVLTTDAAGAFKNATLAKTQSGGSPAAQLAQQGGPTAVLQGSLTEIQGQLRNAGLRGGELASAYQSFAKNAQRILAEREKAELQALNFTEQQAEQIAQKNAAMAIRSREGEFVGRIDNGRVSVAGTRKEQVVDIPDNIGSRVSKSLNLEEVRANALKRRADTQTLTIDQLAEQRAGPAIAQAGQHTGGKVSDTTRQLAIQDARNQIIRDLVRVEKDVLLAQQGYVKTLFGLRGAGERSLLAQEKVALALDNQSPVIVNTRTGAIRLANAEKVVANSLIALPAALEQEKVSALRTASANRDLATTKVKTTDAIAAEGQAAQQTASASQSGQGQVGGALGKKRKGGGLGQGLMFALAFAAPYVAQGAESLGGVPGEDLSTSGRFRATAGAATGGAISGAATGALLGGSVAGPLGAAIGAVGGGLIGLVSSISDASKKIREAELGKALSDFGERIKTLAGGGSALGIGDSITEVESLTRRNARAEAGRDDAKFASLFESRRREAFGSSLPEIGTFLSAQAEGVGRRSGTALAETGRGLPVDPVLAGRQIDELVTTFRSGSGGLNNELLGLIARIRNVPVGEVVDQFRRNIVAAQRQEVLQRQSRSSENETNVLVSSFGRLTNAIEAAGNSVIALRDAAATTSSFFENRIAPLAISGLPETLRTIGTGTDPEGLRTALGTVSAPLGSSGGSLTAVVTAIDRIQPALVRSLGSVLRSSDLLSAEGEVGNRVRQDLFRQLGGGTEGAELSAPMRTVIESITARLNAVTPTDFRERAGSDVVGFSRTLGEQFNPLIEQLQGIGRRLQEVGNEYISGLADNQRRLESIGSEYDRLFDITAGATRQAAELESARGGRPGDALSFLTLEQTQRPFVQRQQRLTAGAGLNAEQSQNPQAIADALSRLQERLGGAQQAAITERETTGRSGAAAVEFTRLQSQATSLTTALRNLGDVTARTATIQERLGRIQEERQSRLAFGERALTADPGQRSDISRGLVLARQAQATGNIQLFNLQQRRAIFESLTSLGNARLGGERAGDIRNRLVASAGFDVRPEDANEEESLRQALTQNTQEAIVAQRLYIDRQSALQTSLFENLQRINERLINGLGVQLASVREAEARRAVGGNEAEAGRVNAAGEARRRLLGLGLTTTAQAEALGTGGRANPGLVALAGRDRELGARVAVQTGLGGDISSRLNRAPGGGFSVIAGLTTPGARTTAGESLLTRLIESGSARLGRPTTVGETASIITDLRNTLRTGLNADIARRVRDGRGTEADMDRISSLLQASITRVLSPGVLEARRTRDTDLAAVATSSGATPGAIFSLIQDMAARGTTTTTRDLDTFGTGPGRFRIEEADFARSVTAVTTTTTRLATELEAATTALAVARARLEGRAVDAVAPTPTPVGTDAPISGAFARTVGPIGDLFRRITGRADGGLIYAASGKRIVPNSPNTPQSMRRGTDTVLSALQPGDFVVNKEATANNLDLLEQISAGKQSGAGSSNRVLAVLTPGEYVVDKEAAQQNLPLLEEINGKRKAMSAGGIAYLAGGGILDGIFERVANALDLARRAGPRAPVRRPIAGRAARGDFNLPIAPDRAFGEQLSAYTDPQLTAVFERGKQYLLNFARAAGNVAGRNPQGQQVATLMEQLRSGPLSNTFNANAQAVSREDKIALLQRIPSAFRPSLLQFGVRAGAFNARLEGLDADGLRDRYINNTIPILNRWIEQATGISTNLDRRILGEERQVPRNERLITRLSSQRQAINTYLGQLNASPRQPELIRGFALNPGSEQRETLLRTMRLVSLGFRPFSQGDVNAALPEGAVAALRERVGVAREAGAPEDAATVARRLAARNAALAQAVRLRAERGPVEEELDALRARRDEEIRTLGPLRAFPADALIAERDRRLTAIDNSVDQMVIRAFNAGEPPLAPGVLDEARARRLREFQDNFRNSGTTVLTAREIAERERGLEGARRGVGGTEAGRDALAEDIAARRLNIEEERRRRLDPFGLRPRDDVADTARAARIRAEERAGVADRERPRVPEAGREAEDARVRADVERFRERERIAGIPINEVAANAGEYAGSLPEITDARNQWLNNLRLLMTGGAPAREIWGPREEEAFNLYRRVTTRLPRELRDLRDEARVLGGDIDLDAIGFAKGGYVPGTGSKDNVKALLTPGEFVMNKAAVDKLGANNLAQLQRFAEGGQVGPVYMQTGGAVGRSGGAITMTPETAAGIAAMSTAGSMLAPALTGFAGPAQQLANSLNGFGTMITGLVDVLGRIPETISLEGRHTVEVIINGAQVLTEIEPGIQRLIDKGTNAAIDRMLEEKFPDVGRRI